MLKIIVFVLTALTAQDPAKLDMEDFLKNPFPYEVTPEILVENYPKGELHSAPIKNLYNPHQTDTIYKFDLKKNSINLTKSGDYIIVKEFNIKDDRIELRNGIKVGMTRDELMNKFSNIPGITRSKDAVFIYNQDQSIRCFFFFKNDKLNGLRYDRLY